MVCILTLSLPRLATLVPNMLLASEDIKQKTERSACHSVTGKMTNKSANFEIIMAFAPLRVSTWKEFYQNVQHWKQICYRTIKYTACLKVEYVCSFQAGNVTLWDSEGVKLDKERNCQTRNVPFLDLLLIIFLNHFWFGRNFIVSHVSCSQPHMPLYIIIIIPCIKMTTCHRVN